MYESAAEKMTLSPEQARLFSIMNELDLSVGEYVLTGSAALVAQGIKRLDENGNPTSYKDIDIIVTPEYFLHLKQKGEWQSEVDDKGEKLLRIVQGVECEVFTMFEIADYQRSATDLLRSAARIEGVPCMSLSEIKLFKQTRGLPKDKQDIAAITKSGV